jgi:4,4'-diaponeurosporenoate glycosyltransferase
VSAIYATFVAGGLACGVWFLARTDAPAGRRDPGPPVAVSIVVPARNEAANLPALLTTTGALDPPAHEVIVVDDASHDGTDAVAAAAGVTVLRAPPPPPGWLGKPWACHLGAAAATGTHLLFVDADVRLAPDALGRLVAEHARRGGLVSVQPYHVTRRPYEQLSAYANVVAMMGTGAFAPRRDHRARGAFGACVFTSLADYQAAGGHAAVRGHVVEDVELAARYTRSGRPVAAFAGGRTVQFRMYPHGPRQLVEGWSKNLALGATRTDPVATAGATWWVAANAAVAVRAVVAVAAFALGSASRPLVPLVVAAVTAAELWWLLRRVGAFRWWAPAVFPVLVAAFVALFLRSVALVRVRRRVAWRGREISVDGGHP